MITQLKTCSNHYRKNRLAFEKDHVGTIMKFRPHESTLLLPGILIGSKETASSLESPTVGPPRLRGLRPSMLQDGPRQTLPFRTILSTSYVPHSGRGEQDKHLVWCLPDKGYAGDAPRTIDGFMLSYSPGPGEGSGTLVILLASANILDGTPAYNG